MANPDAEKADSRGCVGARAGRSGRKQDLKPRDIITEKSIENAVSLIMAPAARPTPCCIIWPSPHAAEVEWSIDDFERMRAQVPVLCDLKPSGRYVATDLHARRRHARRC